MKEQLAFTGDDNTMANLLLNVIGAFVEFERSLIRERQREDIALAKKRGAYCGRAPSLGAVRGRAPREGRRRRAEAALARDFGISRETVYPYVRTEA